MPDQGGGKVQQMVRTKNSPFPGLYKRLFSLQEAAGYLGRSTWSVRRLIWNGELPSVRAGGRVHVDVRDMDMFIETHKVKEDTFGLGAQSPLTKE